MSTTKLPEAFEPMDNQQRKDRFANGYNACLEATGAKELWEALNDLTHLAEHAMRDANRDGGEYDIDAELSASRLALAKSNPSNTVG